MGQLLSAMLTDTISEELSQDIHKLLQLELYYPMKCIDAFSWGKSDRGNFRPENRSF
jgi:hypothetical protein